MSYQITTLNHRVQINSTTNKVWQTLSNIEEVEEYNPQIEEAKCISVNRQGINASRQCTMKDGSIVKEKVISVDPYKSITMELYESSWPVKNMKWRTTIEPNGRGTLVTQKLEYQVKYGALGAILNSLFLHNKMNSSMNEIFQLMKTHIETNP